jgi:cell division septum initiation protein DivIVA
MQAEARETRRAAKEEAGRVVAQARTEADELRSAARSMLADARAEVAVLGAHRDEISKQLNDLSGVINALAVADRPAATESGPQRPANPAPTKN